MAVAGEPFKMPVGCIFFFEERRCFARKSAKVLRQKVVQALYRDGMPKVYCRMDIKSVANYRIVFTPAENKKLRSRPGKAATGKGETISVLSPT